jgi:MFS family permease
MDTAAERQIDRTPFFAVLVSYAMVYFSLMIALVAVPWFVLETTGSAARTGIVAAIQGIPMIFAGIFGGVIVDRVGFRRTAMISDFVAGFAFGMIPLLYYTTGITFWQLLFFVFLRATFDTPGFTARHSMMPDIAKRAGIRLERANSTVQTLMQSAMLLAPASAGLLIGVIGSSSVLWISTGMFFVSVTALGFFVPTLKPSSQATVQSQTRYLGQLKGGLSFVFSSRIILALMITVMAVQFIRANQMVILPVYGHDIFESASAFGFMFGAMGAGGLVTAIAFGIWGHGWPRRTVILVGASSLVFMFLMLAATPPYWIILVGMFITGLMNGPMIPLVFTLIQENTPAEFRGRVFGLYDAAIFTAMVPGRLLAGLLIEWTSLVQTLLIIGLSYILAVVGMILNPNLRDLRPPEKSDSDDEAEPAPDDPPDVDAEPVPSASSSGALKPEKAQPR